MKKETLLIALVAGVFLASCGGNTAGKKQDSEDLNKTAAIFDKLVQSAVIDSTGSILEMAFNPTNDSALFVFNGEIIELKADTVASGIRYSNKDYVFSEWHGEITLTKNGKVVFTHKNSVNGQR
jgi:membrane-bound inhibitor of C-type lysozyme